MKTFQIQIDKREKNPLPLPGFLEILDPAALPTKPRTIRVQIETVPVTLEVADYVLEKDQGVVYASPDIPARAGIVERKAALDEVATNLFDPVRRPALIRLLSRMAERWKHPCLVVEGGLATLFRKGRLSEPGPVIDGLQRLTLEYGVPIQLLDGRGLTQRQHIGEWVARYLVNASLRGGWDS